MINIIAGKNKRAKIEVPNKNVRPTSSLKREAIFSIVESHAFKNNFEIYINKCIIDFYAGSGSLGLEALSRGASFSYFYENNFEVLEILKKNCKRITESEKFEIISEDINKVILSELKHPVSVILIDPPYKINPFKELLNKIYESNILNKNSIIVIETNIKNKINIDLKFSIFNEKKYGKTKLIFLKKL